MNNFWNYKNLNNILVKNKINKPKLITAIGMFYDLEDPSKFISDAAKSLDDGGVFIAQLMCLEDMIKKNDLGNICHEHLEFYSYKSLKYLFEKNGLKIFKIEKNNINGGSYRVYCNKTNKNSIKVNEKTSLHHVRKFISRVEKNKTKCLKFLDWCKKNNKEVFIYGASTKGNTYYSTIILIQKKLNLHQREAQKNGENILLALG